MCACAAGAIGVAAVAGLALTLATTPWLLAVGVAAIVSAWLYTGGPRPYGYAGLGEIFVFVFFGVVPVAGTVWLQRGALDANVLLASLPVATSSMGKGTVAETHALSMGVIGYFMGTRGNARHMRALIDRGALSALRPVRPGQIQPSSVDLRLGARAWPLLSSFLPGARGVERGTGEIAPGARRAAAVGDRVCEHAVQRSQDSFPRSDPARQPGRFLCCAAFCRRVRRWPGDSPQGPT